MWLVYVWCVFDGDAEFAQITSELFDAVVVALDGVGGELLQTAGQPLGLADLTRSDARTLFVEDVLHFDGEYLPERVELLGTLAISITFIINFCDVKKKKWMN